MSISYQELCSNVTQIRQNVLECIRIAQMVTGKLAQGFAEYIDAPQQFTNARGELIHVVRISKLNDDGKIEIKSVPDGLDKNKTLPFALVVTIPSEKLPMINITFSFSGNVRLYNKQSGSVTFKDFNGELFGFKIENESVNFSDEPFPELSKLLMKQINDNNPYMVE